MKAVNVFYETLNVAIKDLLAHGYDSQARLDSWLSKIAVAARASLVPEAVLDRALKDSLVQVFTRAVERGQAAEQTPRD